MNSSPDLICTGWVEWALLLSFGGLPMRAKIDTGARTSALHVEDLRVTAPSPGPDGSRETVAFQVRGVGPLQGGVALRVEVPLLGRVAVRDSGGHIEVRPVIETQLGIGPHQFLARITLTSRTEMLFPMLVGRTALAGRFTVDPSRRFLLGGPPTSPSP